MAVKAQQKLDGAADGAPRPKPKPISESRMIPASFVRGETLIVTLEGTNTIEAGVQDNELWDHVGVKLCMHQWVEVTNDAGSMWRLMRVSRVHGSPGDGLRGLVLDDIIPPVIKDLEAEPLLATGDWRVEYRGDHLKWIVVSPRGVIRRDRINTEAEARSQCLREASNPRPL